MRIVERSPDQRQLQSLFLPQEPRRVMPSDVGEEIILTHPAQPGPASFRDNLFRSGTNGSPASTTVDGPLSPQDRYWWVQVCDVFHNDPVDRTLWLVTGNSTIGFTTVLNPFLIPAGQAMALNRVLLIPPLQRLRGRADAMAAGQFLSITFIYVEYLLAENHPGL